MRFERALEVGEDAGTSDRVYRFYAADSEVKEVNGVPYIQLHQGDYLYNPTLDMIAVVTKIEFEKNRVLVIAECHDPFAEKFTPLQSGKLFKHIKHEVAVKLLKGSFETYEKQNSQN